MQPLISVIMPVHNTGAILYNSISDILNQKYEKYEFIIVDDASNDKLTLKCLSEVKNKDKRINLIRLDTSVGAGEARNYGIRLANGKYLIFPDSDDRFDEKYLESMVKKLIETESDMCVCNYDVFDHETNITKRSHINWSVIGVTNNPFNLRDLGEAGLCFFSPNPWNKMVSKELIDKKGVSFQSLNSSNDVFYSIMITYLSHRIVYTDEKKPLVHYRTNCFNQISCNRNPLDSYRALNRVLQVVNNRDEVFKCQLFYFMVVSMLSELNDKNENSKKAYYQFQNILRDNADLRFDNKAMSFLFDFFSSQKYKEEAFSHRYEFQLMHFKEEIRQLFINNDKVILWGNGKRGSAFQGFLRNNGINNLLVTDKYSEMKETGYGYDMIETSKALSEGSVIIASNRLIYDELADILGKERVVDLMEYMI